MNADTVTMNWDEARALARRLNETENGCCLHITINDSNVGHSHVAFCRNEAVLASHPDCERLGAWLADRTEADRSRFVEEIWDAHSAVTWHYRSTDDGPYEPRFDAPITASLDPSDPF